MEGYIAQIIMFAGNFAPRSWAYCDGSLLSIAQNTAVFALLGTTYGGNGQTTFGLPDLRGRVPVGTFQGPGLANVDLGEMAGSANTTLIISQMPQHNHLTTVNVAVSDTGANTTEGDGKILGAPVSNIFTAPGNASGNLGGVTATTGLAGGNQPFSNMQPYLGMNYVICLEGIFPSRN